MTLHLPSSLIVGGSSNANKNEFYSYKYDSVSFYEFYEAKERDGKKPILRFLGRPTVIFQLPGQNLQIQLSWSLLIRLEN
jgi:hypothetical protein